MTYIFRQSPMIIGPIKCIVRKGQNGIAQDTIRKDQMDSLWRMTIFDR